MLNKNNLPLITCGLAFMVTCVVAYWYIHLSSDTLYLSIMGQSMVQFGPAELSNWSHLYRVFPTIIVMYLSSFLFDNPLPKLWLAFIAQASIMVAGLLFLLKVLLRERMNKNTAALAILLSAIPIYLQFHQNLRAYDTLGNSGHFGAYVLIPPIWGCIISFLRGDSSLYIIAAGIMCFLAIVSSLTFVPFGMVPLLAFMPAYLLVKGLRWEETRRVLWAVFISLFGFALGMLLLSGGGHLSHVSAGRSLMSRLEQTSWYIESIFAIPRFLNEIDIFIIYLLGLFFVAMITYLIKNITLTIFEQRATIATTDWNIVALVYVSICLLIMTFLGPLLGNIVDKSLSNFRFAHPLSILLGIGFVYTINRLNITEKILNALLFSGGVLLLCLNYSSYDHRRLKAIPDTHPTYFIEELRNGGVPLQNGFAQYWEANTTAAFLDNTRILPWGQFEKELSFGILESANAWKRPYLDSNSIYNFVLHNIRTQPDARPVDDLPEGYITYKDSKFPDHIVYYYPGSQLDQVFKKIYQSHAWLRTSDDTPPNDMVLVPAHLPAQTGRKQGGLWRMADEMAGDKAGHLSFGPYATMTPGTYDVSVKYSGATPDGAPVGWWDMGSGPEKINFFKADLLPTSNEEMTAQKRVVLESKTSFVEVRTYFNGRGRMQVESITITPVRK